MCTGFTPLEVHYEYLRPVPVILNARRLIEISHWGNVAVEEVVEIQNAGAKLEGQFSRLDYARSFHMPGSPQNALPSLKLVLPAGAHDMYYRDVIGNISTSNVLHGPILELMPRFPLLPGWKTVHTMGYNLPASAVLSVDRSTGRLRLNTTLFTPIAEHAVPILHLEVKVLLPEGSSNWDVSYLPKNILKTVSTGLVHTYLDVSGRPAIAFSADNLTPDANVYFVVDYNFSYISMLQEPMLLIGVFGVFLVLIVLSFRLGAILGMDASGSNLTTASVSADAQWIVSDGARVNERREQQYDALLQAAVSPSAATTYASARSAALTELNRLDLDARKTVAAAERALEDQLQDKLVAIEEIELMRHKVVSSILELDLKLRENKLDGAKHSTARADLLARYKTLNRSIADIFRSVQVDKKTN